MISKISSRFGKGFTLIELMIVVAIIGILAAIAIPNFIKFQCRSKQSEGKTNLKSMYVAQQSYLGEYDQFVALATTDTTSTNIIGFVVQGKNIRYDYSATASAAGADPTFLGTAEGKATNDMEGDTWQIDETNQLNALDPGFCN